MNQNHIYLEQNQTVLSMIEASHARCQRFASSSSPGFLPPVSKEMKEECKKHVSGHTLLIRESSPQYYSHLTETLDAHHSLLFYVAENLDIYGKYGNQDLNEELKSINVRFGTNLSEESAGTNAAFIASKCSSSVWTVGEQNYSPALHPYAFYAFRINGRYNRTVYCLLVTRKENLTEETVSLFQFIEATESIFGSGLVTEDVLIKDALIRDTYSDERTENILIIVGSSGHITYANNIFYKSFQTSWDAVINYPLEQVVPELKYVADALKQGTHLDERKRVRFEALNDREFLVNCTHVSREMPSNGIVVTIQKLLMQSTQKTTGSSNAKYTFDDLIGVSNKFLQLKHFAQRIAGTDCTVLIRGESGTGKELFAQSIHNASSRSNKPFVSINCAAIPRELIGSELFGYVGGAFTGASKNGAKGKFELADGGTLFLDEIGEMPIDMQSVLLRVLEDGSVTRIGGDKAIPVNVRLIAATNQNLEELIHSGKFRLDLFYRLNVISLIMIPLRERPEDIDALIDYFIVQLSRKHHKSCEGLTAEARLVLRAYGWPGNAREVRNIIERGVITADGGFIGLHHLPPEITNSVAWHTTPFPIDGFTEEKNDEEKNFNTSIAQIRKDTAKRLMIKYDGNKSKVAKEMNIARSTLYRILRDIES